MTPPPPFLCAGAAHWDVIGRTAPPLPPGADVPGRVTRRPGGVAQNIARALAALGRPVTLLSAIGRDRAGDELVADLAAAGIDVTALHRHDGPTDTYLALEGPGGALHAGIADCTGLERAGSRPPRRRLPRPARLVLDGNLPAPVLAAFLRLPSRRSLALVPASPEKAARLAPLLAARPATLYLNRPEAEALAARPFPDSRAAAAALLALGAAEAIVTDGPRPATAAGPAGAVTLAPPPVARRQRHRRRRRPRRRPPRRPRRRPRPRGRAPRRPRRRRPPHHQRDPMTPPLAFSAEVAEAIAARRPLVALESTIITHGMPFPANLDTARAVEAEIRAAGATPATMAVTAAASASASRPPSSTPSPPPRTCASSPAPTSPSPSPRAGPAPPPSPPR